MDQGRTVRKVFESKPEGRRRGRMGLLEDKEKDLREMKVQEMASEESGEGRMGVHN